MRILWGRSSNADEGEEEEEEEKLREERVDRKDGERMHCSGTPVVESIVVCGYIRNESAMESIVVCGYIMNKSVMTSIVVSR